MAGAHSAGTLIGAVLESTGYHYQSAILDELAAPFANEVGGLIYLVGIIVAVTYMATQGSYKLGPWLLIGPPLFFATVQVRDPINNARWQHGFQQRPQERVDEGVADSGGGEGQANVSMLFKRYVEAVSISVNEIVNKMSKGRENSDLWFILKSELFSLMHTARIEDVGFQRLLHHAVFLDCGKLIEWGKLVNDPLFRDATNPVVAERYRASPEAQEAKEFLRPSQEYANQQYNNLYDHHEVNLTDEAARYVAVSRLGDGASEEQIQEETRKVQGEVKSCKDVWDTTVKVILKHAERNHEKLRRLGEYFGIERNVIDNLLAQAQGVRLDQPLVYQATDDGSPEVSPTDAVKIARAISVFFLRNEEAVPDRGSWIAYFANRHESRDIRIRTQGFNSFTEQARLAVREWSEKERLIHAAGSLPYLQGLSLYFLGIFFPFFALLLLVPGKQGGFLVWFTLWLWVKSWDIGVAIVMLLEETIFAILATEKQELNHVPQITEATDMGVAFAALRDLDPTFQLSTYYSIIGTCILAVPPAMGQLILGSMRAGALLVAQGSRQFSQIYADAALAHDTRQAMQALRADSSALKHERAKRYSQALAMGRSLIDESAKLDRSAGQRAPAGAGGGGRGGAGGGRRAPGVPAGALRGGGRRGGVEAPPLRHLDSPRPAVDSIPERQAQADQARPGAALLAFSEGRSATGQGKNPFDTVARAVQSQLAGARYDEADYESVKKLQEQEAKFVAALANWDQDTSDRQHEIYRRIAVYGGIPIPWTNFTSEDSSQLIDLAMAHQDQEIRQKIALYKTRQDSYNAIHGAIEQAIKAMGRPELQGNNPDETLARLRQQFQADPNAQGRFQQVLEQLGSAGRARFILSFINGPDTISAREREEQETQVAAGMGEFMERLNQRTRAWLMSPNGPPGYREDFSPDHGGRLVDHHRFTHEGNDGASIDPREPQRPPIRPAE